MRNTDQVRENAEAARKFKPLSTAEMDRMRDAFLAAGPTLCPGCDGRCSHAGGTTAELGNLTRFLTYHEHHGYRGEARRLYSEMTEAARNWSGADLEAARAGVPQQARLRQSAAQGRSASRLKPTPDEQFETEKAGWPPSPRMRPAFKSPAVPRCGGPRSRDRGAPPLLRALLADRLAPSAPRISWFVAMKVPRLGSNNRSSPPDASRSRRTGSVEPARAALRAAPTQPAS